MKLRMGMWMGMTVLGALAISAGSALAANPTNWTTSMVTVDTSTPTASWDSPTPIDLGYPSYQYSYTITDADAQIASLTWVSVLSELGSNAGGNGSFAAPPITLVSTSFNETELGTTITGDLLMNIDSSGYGHLSLSNFSFSGGSVTGLRAAGQVTVTGVVPEPTCLSLMGLAGGLLLLRRREAPAA